mgnify:CR=1 FL=1
MEPLPALPIGEGLEDLKRLSSAYPFYFFTLLPFYSLKICFVGAWYGQDAHTSYFLLFYFFTLLLLKASFTFNS